MICMPTMPSPCPVLDVVHRDLRVTKGWTDLQVLCYPFAACFVFLDTFLREGVTQGVGFFFFLNTSSQQRPTDCLTSSRVVRSAGMITTARGKTTWLSWQQVFLGRSFRL